MEHAHLRANTIINLWILEILPNMKRLGELSKLMVLRLTLIPR